MGYQDRRKLWFGTAAGGMSFFPTPLSGAEMSPEAWSDGGTLLNGGGYQQNSFGSHKTYTFEWPASSSRETAALMKAYADGTYGRGLLYFIDPLIYDKNILPAQWADPSMVLDYEGASHVYGVDPAGADTGRPGVEVRRNLSRNPVARVDTAFWSTINGGGSTSTLSRWTSGGETPVGGVNHIRVTVTTAGTWFRVSTDTPVGSVTPGETYTLSAWVKGSAATDGRLLIQWFNAAGSSLGDAPVVGYTLTGSWARVNRTVTAPAGASYARLMFGRTTSAVGDAIDVVGVLFEQSAVVGSYFDGSVSPAPDLIPSWTGVANASPSTLTQPLPRTALPYRNATYDLANVTAGFRGTEDAVFIPIPRGHSLLLGAIYTATGSGGVFASWQDSNGVIQSAQRLTALPINTVSNIVPDVAVNGEGVWLWVGKSATGAATVTLTAMIARLVKSSDLVSVEPPNVYGDGFYGEFVYGGALPYRVTKLFNGPWEPGMGHSGCRFIGKPTYIANTGVNGGQVSFSASFREIGSWLA